MDSHDFSTLHFAPNPPANLPIRIFAQLHLTGMNEVVVCHGLAISQLLPFQVCLRLIIFGAAS